MVKYIHILGLIGALALTVLLTTTTVTAQTAPKHPVPLGNDVSYPQCGHKLPHGQAFGIVGANNGSANSVNPCLKTEISWAGTSSGTTIQPTVALYANTGNPGDYTPAVADWPTTSNPLIDPYGLCSGGDDQACSWEYGYERAYTDAQMASAHTWWLDIETVNSWSTIQQNNRADLEGMVYAFLMAGSRTGDYSIPSWWNQILGTVPPSSSLFGLTEWRPGASTQAQAQANCKLAPFTTAQNIVITQYTENNLDYDVSCY